MSMTDRLSAGNDDDSKSSRVTPASFSGRVRVVSLGVHPKQVALRLKAVMSDLEMETVVELAEFIGAERSQVSNWLQGYNLPPIPWMTELCRKRPGLTLDWIFRGVSDGLPSVLAIKLEALELGMAVPLNGHEATGDHGDVPSGFPGGARKRGRKKATRHKMAT